MSREEAQSNKELAGWVVAKAKAAGVQECRVKVSSRRFVSLRYREHRPEFVSEAGTRSLSLEVFADGRTAAQETPDFRKTSLEGFISDTVARAKITEQDPFRCLPDRDRYGVRPNMDLALVDPEYSRVSIGERHRLAKQVEQSCLDQAGDGAISVEATVHDQDYEEWILTSNGFEGAFRATEFWAGAAMTVRDQGDRKPAVWYFGGARRRKEMPLAETIGAQLAQRAQRALGASKSALKPCPLSSRTAARAGCWADSCPPWPEKASNRNSLFWRTSKA